MNKTCVYESVDNHADVPLHSALVSAASVRLAPLYNAVWLQPFPSVTRRTASTSTR